MKLFLKIIIVLSPLFLSACAVANPATPATATKESVTFKNTVLSLTFDDGDADNYSVRPILKAGKLRATFYIVSGFTGAPGYMTKKQLRSLYADGNEIGGHTLSHTNLTTISGADLKREICQDRVNLLAYKFDVISFAYPYGHYNAESRQAVIECGYNNARAVSNGPEIIPPVDAYAIQAMPYIVKDTDFQKMTRYVTQVEESGGGWVALVFHHVCDECDQYSVKLETFMQFAQWLVEQQKNGLVIKTVGEVIGGDALPGVKP
jgi:peptidoglycan/xylan/chitin deacetylase (PgdA/CDA1 family)